MIADPGRLGVLANQAIVALGGNPCVGPLFCTVSRLCKRGLGQRSTRCCVVSTRLCQGASLRSTPQTEPRPAVKGKIDVTHRIRR